MCHLRRAVVIGVVALSVFQCGTWLLFGRRSLPQRVATDILELTGGGFFLDEDSLEAAPERAHLVIKTELLRHPLVSLESDLPPNNRTQLGTTGDGRPLHAYRVPYFGLSGWVSTPRSVSTSLRHFPFAFSEQPPVSASTG